MTIATSPRRLLVISAVMAALVLAGCGDGEDRPRVDVIEDSGSASGSSGSVSANGPVSSSPAASPSGAEYATASNVDAYFAVGLDLRDIRAVMAPASQGQPVDWAQATAIYQEGKNQTRADGTVRSLASIPNDDVQKMFANGASVYGRPNFIDAMIRDGLNGTGRGQGLSDDSRRQIVDKGVQMLMYGTALQELSAARTRIEQKNLDNNAGAPHAVDEAWAIVAGAPDNNGARPHALLQTATSREGNFKLDGKIRRPLETSFMSAQKTARTGDPAAFDRAYSEVKSYLNSIFYLGTLRYAKVLEGDVEAAARETHLAEGWAFFQTIRATVASASPSAVRTVEDAYSRSPGEAFPASATTSIYSALNEPGVIRALGIPASVVVTTPPVQ